jgi:hypothetical protein
MEHWGTLSLKDHIDARALATEVLIYDRLIMPDWTTSDYKRWVCKGWEPDKLRERMDRLGEEIAYSETWSSAGSVALAIKGALLDGFVPLRPQGTLLHGSGRLASGAGRRRKAAPSLTLT